MCAAKGNRSGPDARIRPGAPFSVPAYYRKADFVKRRLTRLISALALAALAGTGIVLADDIFATTQQDTGWGAPDPVGTTWTPAGDTGAGADTALGDSGWG